ncbi:ABC transporter ATP-binding protein [Leucobacter massiliensis]|uniref:ABC transporter ATP-binding protein n=1 Tax=Leucobacter massiliensis TaxID=1686285 RepID=A0A2S9QRD5_9MICO|nr:ABC transporter ATP-binding protein [Leucobacter massiliensis]PRI12132.1 ABC transporter ATP-binding protein [Leucobacter massiliensis]
MSITSPALLMRDVTLEFGDGDSRVRALDSVELELAPGEFVGVIGPSGAGKSSLLATAGALAAPDSGRVEVLGRPLAELGRRAGALARFRREHIGFVFQSGNLIPALSAQDQLRLVNRIAGGPRSFDPAPLLDAVGMAHRARHLPRQLSGGERQRVGIARALVTRPSLLLVDEPTAALDRARSRQVVSLLAEQSRERGVATLMVTHDHGVLDHCDRLVEMVDGRLSPVPAPAHAPAA